MAVTAAATVEPVAFEAVAGEPGIGLIRMQNPPVNGMNPRFAEAFERAVDAAVRHPDVSVVLLTSALPRTFSAGADAAWFAATLREQGPEGFAATFERFSRRLRQVFQSLHESDRLFVAVIGGHAVAGGMELAAACDVRLAADDDGIKLGLPEMALFGALPSGGGGTQYLARLLGPARALDLILTAENLSPRQAWQCGLVQRLHPPDRLLEEALAYARRIAGSPARGGIAVAKRAIREGWSRPMADALTLDAELMYGSIRNEAFLEGVRRFSERYAG